MRSIYTLIVLFLGLNILTAQQVEKYKNETYILKEGTIVSVTQGTFKGTVIIQDGKIMAVLKEGEGLPRLSEKAVTIDCQGKYIYPGMIDAGTHLGLLEIGAVSLTKDHNELGDFIPHMEALTAINPSSVNIPVNRVSGVTSVLANPTGGMFPGTSAFINLHGYTPEQMYADFRGVILNYPSSGKRGRWDRRSADEIKKAEKKAFKKLNDIWDKALDFRRIDSIAQANNKKRRDYNPQMEALLPVLSKELPLLLEVNKEKDILSALEWISKKDIRVILTGVAEGWRVADKIAAAKVPVITGPVLDNPRRSSDPYDINYKNASILTEAGILVALRTKETENVRNLPYNAGFAATYGLGTDKALAAITINPARIFGVEDQLGSIEKDKVANLFVITGDPFETKSQLTHLFINGWQIPLESRHTLLYEEFKERSPGLSK